jgi:hypothetical protein
MRDPHHRRVGNFSAKIAFTETKIGASAGNMNPTRLTLDE